jgi:spermidine/putrescine transport system permease protein
MTKPFQNHRVASWQERLLFTIALSAFALYALLLLLVPLLTVLFTSLRQRDFLGGTLPAWSLQGWRDLLSSTTTIVVMRSACYAGITTAVCMLIGLPLAISVRRRTPAFRRAAMVALLFPLGLNALMVTYNWHVLLGNAGVLNGALLKLGIISQPIPLLFTPGAVILGLVGAYLPFFLLAFLTALDQLDDGFLTASAALGAGDAYTIRRVLLPMTRPGWVTGALMVFIPSFSEFVIPDLLGGGKQMLAGNLIQFSFYEGRNWPMGAALSITILCVGCIGLLPLSRLARGIFTR